MVTKENLEFVFRVKMHVEILEITTHIVGSRLIMIKCVNIDNVVCITVIILQTKHKTFL